MPKLLEVGGQEQAILVTNKLEGMFADLESLIGIVDEQAKTEESALAFRQAIARVCGAIVLDVLAPIYRQYPSIKPVSWPSEL